MKIPLASMADAGTMQKPVMHRNTQDNTMSIPMIEELDKIGSEASDLPSGHLSSKYKKYLTAVRDAVVASCRPQLRPVTEMSAEVPEGHVRVFFGPTNHADFEPTSDRCDVDTHYIDIALPSPAYPADFEQAFAESKLDAKDKAAAFKLWKGGAR